MTAELDGRVALVTGATGGIGGAIVDVFAAAGAAVVVTDLDEATAQRSADALTAAGHRAIGAALDVTDADAAVAVVRRAADELGPVDIVVNNAGLADDEDFLTAAPAVWQRAYDVIVKGAVHCSRAALPAMLDRGRGSIVNIASVNAIAFYGHPAYSAAKAALVSLTQSLATRYASDGVRVNTLAPGTIRTPVWDRRIAIDPQVLDHLARWYPGGRVGDPRDVAEAACFLASDRAAFITGVLLPVDGGLTAGHLDMAKATHGI
jgi:meso-butanediol dehydrogenase / (S,S)-butanediol dehydrogenase / diacetyl reductase